LCDAKYEHHNTTPYPSLGGALTSRVETDCRRDVLAFLFISGLQLGFGRLLYLLAESSYKEGHAQPMIIVFKFLFYPAWLFRGLIDGLLWCASY
jgi:hypothetical protein